MAASLPRSSARRRFLKHLGAAGVLTVVGSATGGAMRNPLTAWAAAGQSRDTVLVSIFLRGASDGLNIVCPHGDDDYYNQRGAYGLAAGAYDDLDGFFGLHSSFGPLLPHFAEGRMAAVHATGSHLPTRSHFVAQPNMESGLGLGGWLGRAIGAGDSVTSASGISIGDRTSPQLTGPFSGTVVDTVREAVEAGMSLSVIRPALEALYAGGVAPELESAAVLGALTAIDDFTAIDPSPGEFPNTNLGRDLREAATLIRADIGVRAVAVDSTGWDHHSDGVARLQNNGSQLATALAAFLDDLGNDRPRVMVCVSSEFGRTVHENGSGGTEHGHGNVMLVLGDALHDQGGGSVLVPGGWPGLDDASLHDGRDLAITTDFRSVYAELVERHLGIDDTETVFPGFVRERVGLLHAEGDVDGSGTVGADDVQAVLDGNVGNGTNTAADLDRDGDVDLTDALLLAQRVGNE